MTPRYVFGSRLAVGRRSFRGSTLIEVLVVIVVFLIGILAVAQIFPKGFRILDFNRRATVADKMDQDELARLASNPSSLPDEIVPVTQNAFGTTVTDPTHSPQDLGPQGDQVTQGGNLSKGGITLGPWQRFAGANIMRRIIGETIHIPAPRLVGTATGYYGANAVLQFGPIDYKPAQSNLVIYGNDLVQKFGLPDPADKRDDSEFYVTSASDANITLNLPSGEVDRNFRVSFSAYVQPLGGGVFQRHEYSGIMPVQVAAQTAVLGQYPLVGVTVQSLIAGVTLGTVDTSTIRVQRVFDQVAKTANFTLSGETQPNPYRYKLINEQLGVILFSPDSYNQQVLRSDGRHEALIARVNYDVYDWRIIREDFRLTTDVPSMKQLALRGMRVRGDNGPDGSYYGAMFGETTPATAGFTDVSAADNGGSDNFMLVDLDTGGVYYEKSPSTGIKQISVDKSLGLVTFTSIDPASPGVTADLLLPDGNRRSVRLDGRAVRALYMAKAEFSLQVLKGASQYYRADSAVDLPSNCYYSLPFAGPTQVFFSRSNQGRKVTIGEVYYKRQGDTVPRMLTSQDFTIQFPKVAAATGLPGIDIRDVDPQAVALDYTHGYALRDVKGASLAVRVLWNPETVTFGSDPVANLALLEQWGRGWRKTTDETYLTRAEVTR